MRSTEAEEADRVKIDRSTEDLLLDDRSASVVCILGLLIVCRKCASATNRYVRRVHRKVYKKVDKEGEVMLFQDGMCVV